ncbi:MAG: cysteine desulfurase [Phycisphaeraceae bacterium]|nr:cysteine desulfurase [Phycisphaeraceae bacterium]
MIYLDHNATTRPLSEVVEAMRRAVEEAWANPSSIHRAGQIPRQGIELARRSLAELIGVRPRTLTLCGSGTEAIDLAIRGAFLARNLVGRAAERAGRPAAVLVTTRAEHSAVRELAVDLERREGARVEWASMRADGSGVVDAGALEDRLDALLSSGVAAESVLVSVQWANNETGAVQPVARIATACRVRGVLFHCDGTQWVGKLPARIVAEAPEEGADDPCVLWPDLLTFSPHKFHGPKGVGVLYARAGVRTAPLIHGEQELGRRGGTENVPGILGAGVSAESARAWLADCANVRKGRALRDRLERELLARVADARVNGPVESGERGERSAGGRDDDDEDAGDPARDARLWNTSSVAFPRLEAEALLLLLSERGVAASAGSACSSGSLEPSAVLLATGIPPELAHGTVRFSIGRETTEEEIGRAVEIIAASVERLRGSWRET